MDQAGNGIKLGHWHETVRRARIGRTTKGVAFVLASWADVEGRNIFPSLATLSVAAEVDYRTAKRALAELLTYGLIERVARRSGARGRFDEYRLILAADVLDVLRQQLELHVVVLVDDAKLEQLVVVRVHALRGESEIEIRHARGRRDFLLIGSVGQERSFGVREPIEIERCGTRRREGDGRGSEEEDECSRAHQKPRCN